MARRLQGVKMAFRPPNHDDLITAGSKFGITLSDNELETYESLTAGSAAAYNAVERLYAETAPPAPTGRSSSFPAPADNPLGAWYAPHRDPRRRKRSAAGVAGRDQGQHLRGRSADDERLAHGRGLRAQVRRNRGHPPARGRRDRGRQVRLRKSLLLRCQPHLRQRAGP